MTTSTLTISYLCCVSFFQVVFTEFEWIIGWLVGLAVGLLLLPQADAYLCTNSKSKKKKQRQPLEARSQVKYDAEVISVDRMLKDTQKDEILQSAAM